MIVSAPQRKAHTAFSTSSEIDEVMGEFNDFEGDDNYDDEY